MKKFLFLFLIVSRLAYSADIRVNASGDAYIKQAGKPSSRVLNERSDGFIYNGIDMIGFLKIGNNPTNYYLLDRDGADFVIRDSSETAEQVFEINSTGKVGIPTANTNYQLYISNTNSEDDVGMRIENTGTDSTDDVFLQIRGTATGGDAQLVFSRSGATDWYLGQDNLDNDFKIGRNSFGSPAFALNDSTGDAEFTDAVKAHSFNTDQQTLDMGSVGAADHDFASFPDSAGKGGSYFCNIYIAENSANHASAAAIVNNGGANSGTGNASFLGSPLNIGGSSINSISWIDDGSSGHVRVNATNNFANDDIHLSCIKIHPSIYN